MRVLIIIFTYERLDLLKKTLETIKPVPQEVDVVVLDDGSSYDYSDIKDYGVRYIRLPHTGKRGFFQKWADALYICEHSEADLFVFMPDDFHNLDLEKIIEISVAEPSEPPYAVNIINDGRRIQWTGFDPIETKFGGINVTKVGFVDCGFFCPRLTLELLEWRIHNIPVSWFDRPDKSSGVGYQLSKRFLKRGVGMYIPNKSLADHGDHESVMHPEHRRNQKLISK